MKKNIAAAIRWVWSERVRIIKYLISGVSAVAVDWSSYVLFTRVFDLNTYLANFLSVLMGGVFVFIANKYWSFQARENTQRQSRRFAALFMFNYLFQQYGFFAAVEYLHIYDLLAKTLLIGMMVTWNFLLYKYWVYAVE